MKKTARGALRGFLAFNKRLCARVELRLPQAKVDVFRLYAETVARYMNARPQQVVLDVGGGKSCVFARYRDPAMRTKIIAVDVSEEELRHNSDVDEKRVANITEDLPFAPGEADLIVSRSVLEHLRDLEGFVIGAKTTLKQGGHFIHLFPSRFAPFALINRALPNGLSKSVLHHLRPESKGVGGFPAFYDECYYAGFTRLMEKHGFEVIDVELSYYQSEYYSFFAPFYLASALYEAVTLKLGMKNLCAHMLVTARKAR